MVFVSTPHRDGWIERPRSDVPPAQPPNGTYRVNLRPSVWPPGQFRAGHPRPVVRSCVTRITAVIVCRGDQRKVWISSGRTGDVSLPGSSASHWEFSGSATLW
jgi:hypothetical protein